MSSSTRGVTTAKTGMTASEESHSDRSRMSSNSGNDVFRARRCIDSLGTMVEPRLLRIVTLADRPWRRSSGIADRMQMAGSRARPS
jgi:hypothetical protein